MFGPAFTACHGPLHTRFPGLLPMAPCSLDLTGALGLERDGPSLGWRHQTAVSLCPSHMVAHPAFVVFFSGESFSPGPHPDPSLVWDKGDACSPQGPLSTGCHCCTREISKKHPQTWTQHNDVFKKCFTWKYLIAGSTKMSLPKPHGSRVRVREGCSGWTCVCPRLCRVSVHGGGDSDITFPRIRIFLASLRGGQTDVGLERLLPLLSGLLSS